MVTKPTDTTPASLFFDDDGLPFFANRVTESYALHLHDHEFTELSYVGEGSGFHYIGEETIPVAQGDLFILPLGVSHVFRPRSTDRRHPLVVYNFIFMPDRVAAALAGIPGLSLLPETMQLLNLAPGRPGWRALRDASGAFRSFFLQACQEFAERRPGFVPRLYGLFLQLLTEIERRLADAGGADAGDRPPGHRLLAAARAYIDEALPGPVTARQTAEAVQVSERHLHRLFAQGAGATFHRYVQQLRVERGCELLRTTRMPVQDIAEAVGYQDKGSFVRTFKRITGRSPRAYRAVQP